MGFVPPAGRGRQASTHSAASSRRGGGTDRSQRTGEKLRRLRVAPTIRRRRAVPQRAHRLARRRSGSTEAGARSPHAGCCGVERHCARRHAAPHDRCRRPPAGRRFSRPRTRPRHPLDRRRSGPAGRAVSRFRWPRGSAAAGKRRYTLPRDGPIARRWRRSVCGHVHQLCLGGRAASVVTARSEASDLSGRPPKALRPYASRDNNARPGGAVTRMRRSPAAARSVRPTVPTDPPAPPWYPHPAPGPPSPPPHRPRPA
jgi:hypothetical protein